MRLTDNLKDDGSIMYQGREIEVRLTYDIVLKALELYNDEHFTSNEKFYIWGEMFIINYESINGLYEEDLYNIVEMIFNKISSDESDIDEEEEKSFCFSQDAEYIYSSFKSSYNIDLFEEQNKLEWKKFIGLLKGLPDDSKLKEIIGIRKSKIPKRTNNNKEERERIKKLKNIYALKDTEETIKSRANNLSKKLSMMGEMYAQKR